MFGLGMGEMVLLVVIAIVLFGTNDLPKNLRKAAKGLNEFKKVANDAQRQWNEVRDDVARTIMNADLEEKAREKAAREDTLHAGETPQIDGTGVPSIEVEAASVSVDSATQTAIAESSVRAESVGEPFAGTMPADVEPTPRDDTAAVTVAGVATVAEEPPAIRTVIGTVARRPHEAPVDHSDPHHQERGTEPGEVAAAPGGVQKSS